MNNYGYIPLWVLVKVLSFGIVGVTMASIFIIPVIKEVIYMFKNRLNPELSGK